LLHVLETVTNPILCISCHLALLVYRTVMVTLHLSWQLTLHHPVTVKVYKIKVQLVP